MTPDSSEAHAGKNQLAKLDRVLYLRQFENLELVTLAGNPLCREANYKSYLCSHIKNLKYLDYVRVKAEDVTLAMEQHQDEMLDLKEKEDLHVRFRFQHALLCTRYTSRSNAPSPLVVQPDACVTRSTGVTIDSDHVSWVDQQCASGKLDITCRRRSRRCTMQRRRKPSSWPRRT